MKKFLSYGGRHRVWFPRGYNGKVWPQLNPVSSSSHGANGKMTFGFYEPLWLFRLRNRVFRFAGKQRCGRRDESWIGLRDNSPLPDQWEIMPNGDRTCSYCGSLHPDDMARLVRKCIDTDGQAVKIEPTDKGYKVYVNQKGIVNASFGGIKFYMQHVSDELLKPERQAEYSQAVKISNAAHKREREEWLKNLEKSPA